MTLKELGAISFCALIALGSNAVAGGGYEAEPEMEGSDANVMIGFGTGYSHDNHHGRGLNTHTGYWGFGAKGMVEATSGALEGTCFGVMGSFAWATHNKGKADNRRVRNNGWKGDLAGGLGYNVGRHFGDGNYMVKPMFGWSMKHTSLGRVSGRSRHIAWHGPWSGLAVGGTFAENHMVKLVGKINYLAQSHSNLRRIKRSANGWGWGISGHYRYGFNETWGMDACVGYDRQTAKRSNLRVHGWKIMTGVSASL